jgi:hypothetical protein
MVGGKCGSLLYSFTLCYQSHVLGDQNVVLLLNKIFMPTSLELNEDWDDLIS